MTMIAGCGAAAIALVAAACEQRRQLVVGRHEGGGRRRHVRAPAVGDAELHLPDDEQHLHQRRRTRRTCSTSCTARCTGSATGTQPTLNPSLSLADQPTYNGKQVTITLKNYKWSNGTAVTAQNVLFWIHMLQAVGSTEWGAFVPGGFPTNVTSVKATSPTTLTMTMNKAYSPTWFTYNELSQITPMPKAWDRTASGPSDCTDTVSDCKAVFTYLDSQSKAMSSWASSPVWSVVDGPFKLQSFNADGNATFVPNKSYSGPVKATLSEFKEVPFTTEAAEYNVLRSGNGSQKLSVGYLPTTDAPTKPANATVGANPVPGYTLDPLYSWSINYFVPNIELHHAGGRGHQAAVLPAGAGVPGQPGGGHLRPAARVRHPDGRPGRQLPVDPVPVRPGQEGRPVPLRPRQGQAAAVQPRLEGCAERDQHLHQPEPVRRGRQAGPGPVLHPAVHDGHQLDRVGDDPAQVERVAASASS